MLNIVSILVKPSDAELEDQLSERLANPLPEPKLPAAHWLDTPETRDRQLKIGEEVARVVADINFLKAGLFFNTLLHLLGQSKDQHWIHCTSSFYQLIKLNLSLFRLHPAPRVIPKATPKRLTTTSSSTWLWVSSRNTTKL